MCARAGVMGSVEMDEFGDRQMDFAVWDMMDVESGEFQVKHLSDVTHTSLLQHFFSSSVARFFFYANKFTTSSKTST